MSNNINLLKAQKRKTNWILHLVLTVIFWPWIVVWIVAGLRNASHNQYIDDLILEEIQQNKE